MEIAHSRNDPRGIRNKKLTGLSKRDLFPQLFKALRAQVSLQPAGVQLDIKAASAGMELIGMYFARRMKNQG